MKDQFKNSLKFLLLFLFLAISACEKDLYQESIKQNNSPKTQTLTGKEAEKVALRLKTFLGSHNLNSDVFSKTIPIDMANISYDEILKIIDSYGKENYTFEIKYPEINDKKFANLILQEKDGYTTVKIIEYEMTEAFAQLYKENPSMAEFKGIIKVLPVYSDAPCPDTELIVQIGNVPPNCTGCGGGSNNNGNNPEIPGGIATNPGGHAWSVSLVFYIIFDNGLDNGGSGGTATHVHSGNEPHAKIAIEPIIPTDPSAPADPCPPSTEIGILEPVNQCSKTFLEGLDNPSRQYVYNHGEERDGIMEYIRETKNCDEANQIATELLKELKRGSKIDFVNKIIIDSSFANNQKAMCVYNKMKNNQGFKNFTEPFNYDKPVAFVKLKAGSVPDNDRAITNPPDSNNIIEITINNNPNHPNGINAQPNLFLCQTIIHEVVHAELFRRIIEALGSNPDGQTLQTIVDALRNSNYQKLADYIEQYKDWSHNYMAQQYRKTIARVTEEFETNHPVTGNPQDIYMYYAWRGLDLITVPSWYELPMETQNGINDLIDNYINTHSNESCQ